jgi:hypothetical protein
MLHGEVFIELNLFHTLTLGVKDWFPMLHGEVFIELNLFHTLTLRGQGLVPDAAWGSFY